MPPRELSLQPLLQGRPIMVTLEEATLDQIMDELGNRFTGVLVAYTRDSQRNREMEVSQTRWRGGWTMALGLANFALSEVLAGKKMQCRPKEKPDAEADSED